MSTRAVSPTPRPGALPRPVLRRSLHVWNGLSLSSMDAAHTFEQAPVDLTDDAYGHTAELMEMLDEEIAREEMQDEDTRLASTVGAPAPAPALAPAPAPAPALAREPLRCLFPATNE